MLQPRPPRDQWCVDGSSGEQRRTSAPSQRAVADVVGEIPEQGVARVTRWIDHARFYSLVASYVEVVAKPNIRIADIRCQLSLRPLRIHPCFPQPAGQSSEPSIVRFGHG